MQRTKQTFKKILCCFCNVFISFIFVFSVASCNFSTQKSTSSEKENGKSVFYLLGNETEGQMMGIVLQTVDKKTIVRLNHLHFPCKFLLKYFLTSCPNQFFPLISIAVFYKLVNRREMMIDFIYRNPDDIFKNTIEST